MDNKLVASKIEDLRKLRKDEKSLKSDITALQNEVVDLLRAEKVDEFTWSDASGAEQSTNLSQATRSKLLSHKLKKKLPKDIWERISYDEIDQDLLQLELEAGNITQADVDACKTVTKGNYFVK